MPEPELDPGSGRLARADAPSAPSKSGPHPRQKLAGVTARGPPPSWPGRSGPPRRLT